MTELTVKELYEACKKLGLENAPIEIKINVDDFQGVIYQSPDSFIVEIEPWNSKEDAIVSIVLNMPEITT